MAHVITKMSHNKCTKLTTDNKKQIFYRLMSNPNAQIKTYILYTPDPTPRTVSDIIVVPVQAFENFL